MEGDSQRTDVVVGVDGSGESLVAAHWAALAARRRGTGLRVVHAFTESVSQSPDFTLPAAVNHEERRAAERTINRAAQSVTASFPGLRLTTELVQADARWALVEASTGAWLTVVGTRGHGHLPDVIIGTVAHHVASHAHSPVAVVPASAVLDDDRPAGPILVGVDAGDSCEAAIRYAFDEAAIAGCDVIAALVVDDSTVPPFLRGPAHAGSEEDQREQSALGGHLEVWREKYPDVQVRPVVLRGRPARALLDHAMALPPGGQPRMIVVGSRGHRGLATVLLGSVGRRLIADSVWPVVVVRP